MTSPFASSDCAAMLDRLDLDDEPINARLRKRPDHPIARDRPRVGLEHDRPVGVRIDRNHRVGVDAASGRNEHPPACDAAIACLAAKPIAAGWRIVGALLQSCRLDHHRRLRRPDAPAVDQVSDRLCRCSRAFFPSSAVSSPSTSPAAIFVTRAPSITSSTAARSNTGRSGRGEARRRWRDDRWGAAAWGSPQGHRAPQALPSRPLRAGGPLRAVELGMGGV